MKAPTDDGLVAERGDFPERALAVADGPLPEQASSVLDHPDVLVALRGGGVDDRARHGGGAARDDHCCGWVRLGLGHGAINWSAIIRTISDDRGDGAGDLLGQRADQRGVTLLGGGQLGGQDLASTGIDREVELAPDPLAALAMLFGQPLTSAVYLQPD